MLFIIYLFAYFTGNLLTGVLIGSLFKKGDIRGTGSGNPGARNAGRLYGKKAFVFTFLGDAIKASIVVAVCFYFHLTTTETLFALLLTIIGHIKPILFRFKGGKGISSFIGGILAIEPFMAVVIIFGFLIFYPISKSFTIGGLGSFILIPITAYFVFHSSLEEALFLFLIILVVIAAHEKDIRGYFIQKFTSK
ncbi:glycerol-3-phosphate acyltransferase [Bacillus mesophilum]|uniref:Glycerol-3-phosphate acyltransferase n=1 Tax=Bacillus mesophilum TaxID=1071718 RepID=A0A7V7UT99_9BACI|nr:glycerol-3-phosphate acyltransferase [Bacillus mesophilum]KAB2329841.1 glycerol-3-phosphate acyltransferase [Bacillus mesophilum]